jgi:hypothetical protein
MKDHGRALAGLLVLCPLPPDAERVVHDLSLDFKAPTWQLAYIILQAQKDPQIVEQNLSTHQVIAGRLVTIRYTE